MDKRHLAVLVDQRSHFRPGARLPVFAARQPRRIDVSGVHAPSLEQPERQADHQVDERGACRDADADADVLKLLRVEESIDGGDGDADRRHEDQRARSATDAR